MSQGASSNAHALFSPPTARTFAHSIIPRTFLSTRRHFVVSVSGGLFALAAGPANLLAMPSVARPGGHPEPRPGIDASKVRATSSLKNPGAADAFDAAHEIPHILDGIRCHCSCAEQADKYSLLSCYEGDAMAQFCDICQGQANLARRLVKMRRSLDQIRAAIDAKWVG